MSRKLGLVLRVSAGVLAAAALAAMAITALAVALISEEEEEDHA